MVYTGDRSQSRPCEYSYQGIDTSLLFRFRACQIFDFSEQELLQMKNPFALIILACQKALLEGKVPEEILSEDRLVIAKALVKCGYEHERIVALLVFLKNIIYIKNEEINRIFDQEIQQISGGKITMGIIEVIKKQEREEGKLEGMLEGKLEGKLEGELEKAIENCCRNEKRRIPCCPDNEIY